jgi:hypothetical protein
VRKIYKHQPDVEVAGISGWYRFYKEERVAYGGREYLYLLGDYCIDSSCCGFRGCQYAVVPGSVVDWKSKVGEDGTPQSIVEPVSDEKVRDALREMIGRIEGVSEIQFW